MTPEHTVKINSDHFLGAEKAPGYSLVERKGGQEAAEDAQLILGVTSKMFKCETQRSSASVLNRYKVSKGRDPKALLLLSLAPFLPAAQTVKSSPSTTSLCVTHVRKEHIAICLHKFIAFRVVKTHNGFPEP